MEREMEWVRDGEREREGVRDGREREWVRDGGKREGVG